MRPTLRIRAGYFRLRRVLTALAVLGLGCAGLAAVTAAPASAATSCQVAYSTNDWSTGFTASITITNEGSALTAWTLTYSYTGNQQLTQGWSGNWSQSGQTVTVTNASWNGSLATGAATQIGANFSYSGTNTAPTSFAINGTTCNGTGVTSSPSPTPTATSSPTAPDLVAHAYRVADVNQHRWRRLVQFRPGAASQPGDVLGGPGHQRGVRRVADRVAVHADHGGRGQLREQRAVHHGRQFHHAELQQLEPAAAGHRGRELVRHRRGHVHRQRDWLHLGQRDRD